MSEHKDPHLGILLDIQKQLGVLGRETGEQSKMLVALNEKVAIANGRTAKLETKVSAHQSILDNWKGKLAVIVTIIGLLANALVDWLKQRF